MCTLSLAACHVISLSAPPTAERYPPPLRDRARSRRWVDRSPLLQGRDNDNYSTFRVCGTGFRSNPIGIITAGSNCDIDGRYVGLVHTKRLG